MVGGMQGGRGDTLGPPKLQHGALDGGGVAEGGGVRVSSAGGPVDAVGDELVENQDPVVFRRPEGLRTQPSKAFVVGRGCLVSVTPVGSV